MVSVVVSLGRSGTKHYPRKISEFHLHFSVFSPQQKQPRNTNEKSIPNSNSISHCHFFTSNYLHFSPLSQYTTFMELYPSSLFQHPHTHKPTRSSYSTTSTSIRIAETPVYASVPSPSSRPLELSSLDSLRIRHAQMIKLAKVDTSAAKIQSLITSYLIFGDFRSSATLFFVGFSQNYLYWNNFMEEFSSYGGNPFEILEVFFELHSKRVSFDSKILTVIMKICANLVEKLLGIQVHACLIKKGFDMDVYTKCALMNYYEKCFGVDYADKVFDEMSSQEDQLWNESILVKMRNKRWVEALESFRDMQFSSVKANSFTVSKVLQACGKLEALDEGRQIHGHAIRSAMDSNLLICNSLISMYAKNKDVVHARAVFDAMENHNLSSWNSVISCCTSNGYLNDAMSLFEEMELNGIEPDIVTWNCLLSGHFIGGLYQEVLDILRAMEASSFRPNASSISNALQAASELRSSSIGKELHCYLLRNALDFDVYVETTLLNMYVKNDNLTYAQSVFDGIRNRNIFAWNVLISGYSIKGQFGDALKLMNQMVDEGIKPDLVTYNALISSYLTWGFNKEALDIIHQIKASGLVPNVVTWTALISGCARQEKYQEGLEFFNQMLQEGIGANSATIVSLLKACTGLSSLEKGKEVHSLAIKKGFVEDVVVATALTDMYIKCGSLDDAYKVFKKFKNKTLASWNCMILGFANYSKGKEAISLFNEMLEAGMSPDAITFTALLSGCKHSGLVDEGWNYFDAMRENYNIIPTIEHYSCMVDLLARTGYLDEAWDFIEAMPMAPDATVWGALLGSCRTRQDLEIAEFAAEKLFELEPENAANYVLMMNLYASLDLWEDLEQVRELMNARGVKAGKISSWIQTKQKVRVFSERGKARRDEGEVYFELYHLVTELRKAGYVPDISCVYQSGDDEEKEKVLLTHTEKLAITYGLLKTKNGAPIRVIKNTRVCSDCHSLAKYVSLVRRREILLKDGSRFHHFREGKCSCNDFW